MSRKEVTLLP